MPDIGFEQEPVPDFLINPEPPVAAAGEVITPYTDESNAGLPPTRRQARAAERAQAEVAKVLDGVSPVAVVSGEEVRDYIDTTSANRRPKASPVEKAQ